MRSTTRGETFPMSTPAASDARRPPLTDRTAQAVSGAVDQAEEITHGRALTVAWHLRDATTATTAIHSFVTSTPQG
ncbi:hypothetical protein [Streptomyces fuscichromogenes]|uniref:Uncharacterized protein n=1 Tax=Streptomyces fuscichromogenes TaxID=1324013 RepID=A0A917XNP5_9ACTN|nr:hypothetical protein [Streptomyces fuscichromogenes]GGN42960.1 hypothetical protein GCM10011578_092770 [Streptomyces fuscichromogenes]